MGQNLMAFLKVASERELRRIVYAARNTSANDLPYRANGNS